MPQAITVLVVEDEPLIRMDIVDQLQDLGFRVLEATNATEAVTMLIANKNIQVMFTDVDMPGGMDGRELALMADVSLRYGQTDYCTLRLVAGCKW